MRAIARIRALPYVDVGGPTAGYVAVGVSGFALLASGPRLLGHDEFSVLAIAWTVATIVGVGIGQPGEQTVTRVTAGSGDPAVSAGVQRRLVVVAALTLLLPVLAASGHAPLLGGSVLWSSSVVVFAAGWAMLAGPRGRLAAHRDYAGYSGTLIAESVARVVLCLLAWLVPSAASALLAAAVGIPIVVSAIVARRRERPAPATPQRAPATAHLREQALITAVALLTQIAVNSAPLWLAAGAANPAVAGQFVSLTSYLRIPIFFVGGLGTVALSAVSAAHGRGERLRARRTTVRSAAAAALVGAVGVALLLLVSAPALRLLYGSPLELDRGTSGVIAVTTVLAMTAGVLSLACLATDRSRWVASVWLTAAVTTTVGLSFLADSTLGAAVATAVGQLIALGALAAVAARALGPSGGTSAESVSDP